MKVEDLGFTEDQIRGWRRGELCIEFSFDNPPEVNPRDFERWVRERNVKPNLVQQDQGWTPGNCQTVFSEEVRGLEDESEF